MNEARTLQNYSEFKGCYRKKKYDTLAEAAPELRRLKTLPHEEDPKHGDKLHVYGCRYALAGTRHYHIGHEESTHHTGNLIDDFIVYSEERSHKTRIFKIRSARN